MSSSIAPQSTESLGFSEPFDPAREGISRLVAEREAREAAFRATEVALSAAANAERAKASLAALATPEGRAAAARRKAEADAVTGYAAQAAAAEERMERGSIEGTADRNRGLVDSMRAKAGMLLAQRADNQGRRA
ncbi:hypothetical protein [Microbacterium capsulatum]|uniref:Uncharacterized protein n=1 Tax=Microbacterium capsulatum TaxID=3041921 RepID=A0ABU0XDT0_9MICO|nr:hypothetical protein [Microbacterium sp. ASV81]MDQ4213271.1 hypothetical protein [Microbacterium sp. ASV81]